MVVVIRPVCSLSILKHGKRTRMAITSASIVRSVWLEQPKYEAAEQRIYEMLGDSHTGLKIEVSLITSTT